MGHLAISEGMTYAYRVRHGVIALPLIGSMTLPGGIMAGMTTLGAVHTAIALVGFGAGIAALLRDYEIRFNNRTGKFYVAATFLAAFSGLFIFNHGGFGPPQVLSLLTILTLLAGVLASTTRVFGKLSDYVEIISFSTTLLFHLIPAFTESLIRLPVGAPWLASPDAPEFQAIYGALFVLYGIGLTLQLRWFKASRNGSATTISREPGAVA